MRYFFHIGYLGTHYRGWQNHPDGLGVQQVLERCLSKVLHTDARIIGCGRTDASVHACQFFFHMDIPVLPDVDVVFRLNHTLPDDIAVFDMIPMEGKPHARFDAIARSYDYFIHTYKDPFLNKFSSYYPIMEWDIINMKRAAALLLKYNDYHAFCKVPYRNNHTRCDITEAVISINTAGDRLKFRISANRFLGKMVRIIVGKLMDIGTGKLTVDEFEACLIDPLLPQVIKPAYPQGLFLSKVTYPYLDLPARSKFCQMLEFEI